ncbi:MAG: ABC transporter ATP-binding protein [Paracoccus sp. (in: a-proteobacteria)]|nr:ABC transporter ATP-binding protein [Paracoccus sp. (in: a-proteobacteria)]
MDYGDLRAVDQLTASVGQGRFLALLGPSGCGKTSLLRLIAGLERPSAGTISLGGRVVASGRAFIGPENRNLGMVFQSYALWPHMSVEANIGFGLNRLARHERERRIAEALRMVGLSQMADRKPHALSGGQRQRVALARSLAARPQILLLDEPLANLDAHLRHQMLGEFRRIHAELGCTMVFVTHDQNEAMAVADLVGVMDQGRLGQLAAPQELYERPATPMIARFVGQGRTYPVEVERHESGRCRINAGGRIFEFDGIAGPGPGWLCLHPRDLRIAPEGLSAVISSMRFEDGYHIAELMIDAFPEGDPVPVRLDGRPRVGERLFVALEGGWVLPREGGEAVQAAYPAPKSAAREYA